MKEESETSDETDCDDVLIFSMGKTSHRRSNRVYFYDVGLVGADGKVPYHVVKLAAKQKWRVETLTDIKAMLKHQNVSIM